MANPERISKLIPSRAVGKPQNIGGKVFGTVPPPKKFPRLRKGLQAPFTQPSTGPFDDVVNHYVALVGGAVEQLNGLQFNLTQVNEAAQAQAVSDALATLADALHVGDPNFPNNAKELRWPLAGSYTLNQDPKDPAVPANNLNTLVVDLYFENEPTLRLVVNCTVAVSGQVPAILPESSSSSYIKTSSK